MKSTVFLCIAICILIIGNVFQLWLNVDLKQNARKDIDMNYVGDVLNSAYNYLRIDDIRSSDTIMMSKIPLKRKQNVEIEQISTLDLFKGEKVVFYFPSHFCESCVHDQLSRLGKLANEMKSLDIIVISDEIRSDMVDYFLVNNIRLPYFIAEDTSGFVPENIQDCVLYYLRDTAVKHSFVYSMVTKGFVDHFYEMVILNTEFVK